MPKPLLLKRRSGLYVRFLVPGDLQGQIGSRFILRSLQGARADGARLIRMPGYPMCLRACRPRWIATSTRSYPLQVIGRLCRCVDHGSGVVSR
jgi:hypothetical protein